MDNTNQNRLSLEVKRLRKGVRTEINTGSANTIGLAVSPEKINISGLAVACRRSR